MRGAAAIAAFIGALIVAGAASACGPYRGPENALPNTAESGISFRVLAIGSSSTAGVGAGRREASYPYQIRPALRPWSLHPIVEARGVGGEKAAGALKRMAREIADTEPVLVLWQVGTNDANARLDPQDVAEIIRQGVATIRAAGADAILIDPQYYPRIAGKPRYEAMAEMIDRVGAELNVPVVDRYECMRDADEETLSLMLAADKFHMSAIGHRLLAEEIAHTIRCGLGYQCRR